MEKPSEGEELFYFGFLDEAGEAGSFQSFDGAESKRLDLPCFEGNAAKLLAELSPLKAPPFYPWFFQEKEAYQTRFEKVQKDFKKTDLKKAVLYSKLSLELDSFIGLDDFFAFMAQGLKKKESAYFFAFYDTEKQEALMGISPEYLFNVEGEKVHFVAVAGTQIKEQWNEKLKKEQLLVQEGITKDLGKNLHWSDVQDVHYSDLKHLKSFGEAACRDFDLKTLSKKLHPTPAVGTLPRDFFSKVDLGPEGRGFYGGFVELLAIKEPFSIVTIRGMEWRKKDLQFCVGGGVVQESSCDEELLELEKKFDAFLRLWSFV